MSNYHDRKNVRLLIIQHSQKSGIINNVIGNQSYASTSAFAYKTSGSTLLNSYPSLSEDYWTTDGDTKVPYLSLGA